MSITVYVSYFVQVDQNTGDGVQETRQLVYVIIITVRLDQVHLLTALDELNVHQVYILRTHHFTRLKPHRGKQQKAISNLELSSMNNQTDTTAFIIHTNITHRCKKAISSYSNGELFVGRIHGPDNRAKLLHKELQLAFMLLNIFSHQNSNLQEDQRSTQPPPKNQTFEI